MKKYFFFILSFSLLPLTAFAQFGFGSSNDIFGLMNLVLGWLTDLVPFLVALIILVVFWNLAQFVLKAGDEKEREKYKQFTIWSVVAMFVIISFWGLVNVITSSFFGINSGPLSNPGFVNSQGMPVPF